MAENKNELALSTFYPEESLKITEIIQQPEQIFIKMKSVTHRCICPECKQETNKYHGTYIRKVQDLPILGKRVMLDVNAYEYECENSECSITSFAENFDGFLNSYSRMTERLADFICTLALETSCEGCAKICRETGIQISGDTVIRLLLKRYESQPASVVGDIISIDDFAYKKRHIYGTIIVNGESHEPVTLLEGRDGETLRSWLKENKHIRVITRDRASAYAKVIAEELPDVMQVADRFHLHQNLLEAVKKALNSHLPSTITIPKDTTMPNNNDNSKKNRIGCG